MSTGSRLDLVSREKTGQLDLGFQTGLANIFKIMTGGVIFVVARLIKTWLKREVPSFNYTLLERNEAPCAGCGSNAGG
jgi:hypothetical protein